MYRFRWYVYGLITSLFLVACSDTVEMPDADNFGWDYFPLEVGKFVEYQVDSTVYDNEGMFVEQTTSFAREEIVEQFIDNAGDTVYRIERFYRAGLEDQWQVTDVWTAGRNATQAMRTEENLRFIKLVFPVEEGLAWNGNIHINPLTNVDVAGDQIQMFKNWDYRMLSVDRAEVIGLKEFDRVLTTQLADDENAIERRFGQEKYARGVGLIYRELMILDTQCIEQCLGQSWEEKAWQGFILQQTILEYN